MVDVKCPRSVNAVVAVAAEDVPPTRDDMRHKQTDDSVAQTT